MTNKTVHDLLTEGEDLLLIAGIPDHSLVASILLADVIEKPLSTLVFHKEVLVSPPQRELYLQYVQKALTGMPIGYILGYQEFLGFRFHVTPDTLIPRPETEELVEKVLGVSWGGAVVIDVGTGSGAIPCSLRKKGDFHAVYGCDISPAALEVAKQNASSLGTFVTFWETDCRQPEFIDQVLKVLNVDNVYECIITANLPYIPHDEMPHLDKNVQEFEPHLALDGGKHGVEILRPFLENVIKIRESIDIPLKIFLEIDPANQAPLQHFFHKDKRWKTTFTQDLSGHIRFVEGSFD